MLALLLASEFLLETTEVVRVPREEEEEVWVAFLWVPMWGSVLLEVEAVDYVDRYEESVHGT